MKKNTLDTIQAIHNIGKILSKIASIASSIGFIGCAVGFALAYFVPNAIILDSTTFEKFIEGENAKYIGTMYAGLAIGFFQCLGESIVARKEYKYFSKELENNTPFTFDGAKELFSLGIIRIVVPFVAAFLAQMSYSAISKNYEMVSEIDISPISLAWLGAMYILASYLCKLGAEKEEEIKGLYEKYDRQ